MLTRARSGPMFERRAMAQTRPMMTEKTVISIVTSAPDRKSPQ